MFVDKMFVGDSIPQIKSDQAFVVVCANMSYPVKINEPLQVLHFLLSALQTSCTLEQQNMQIMISMQLQVV